MRNDRLQDLGHSLSLVVGKSNVLLEEKKTRFYSTGIRVGSGLACAVVLPKDLLEFWKVLEICVSLDKIIIIQAANTGLTGGSTPNGDSYDRDVVIINTLKINNIVLLRGGLEVLAFPGSTLYQLEQKLACINRAPHSVIGSSCIGASIIGGVCNNSGGNLVNRGPAYTELSLYARLNEDGMLELVNHLDIELGDTPEKILNNLQNMNRDFINLPPSKYSASDEEYQGRVREINSSIPARFNADQRRLYEASGCAGKLAIFAVRLDTFPMPKKEAIFFIGTNNKDRLSSLRKRILKDFSKLPDMGEYMHSSYFDGADKYCKDTFLLIKYLGTNFLPKLLFFKRQIELFFSILPLIPRGIIDIILQAISQFLPDHLPKKIRDYRELYEHFMIIVASDQSIKETVDLLNDVSVGSSDFEYFECNESEGKDILLHRYVAGSAPARFALLNLDSSSELLPLDVAMPRNCDSWHEIFPPEITSQMKASFSMGHFLCMVFHWDFVVKKGVDTSKLKLDIFKVLDSIGAKYPAEHNVGHLYRADSCLKSFYVNLDPTNSFNSGIGKTSKNKFYQ